MNSEEENQVTQLSQENPQKEEASPVAKIDLAEAADTEAKAEVESGKPMTVLVSRDT